MPKKNLPLVCIIIVNWNGGEVIRNCISSLKKTSYKNYKTIIIDNGSKNKKEVESLKKINENIEIVYLDKNYGYTIGTNTGWKYALEKYNADYICAMDSDIVTIQEDWLDIQIKELEKDEKFGISGGKLIFPDGKIQIPCIGTNKEYFEEDQGQFDYVKEVPLIRGACIVIKRGTINKIGYYDENFFYGPNDVDYCYRAENAGLRVLFNGFAKSIHLSGYTGFSHQKDWVFLPQTEGMLIFYLRYKGIIRGLGTSLRFFVRSFVTRKNPHISINFGNLIYHKTVLKRMFFFFWALFSALKNYKEIKQNTRTKIIKIEK